MRGSDRRSGGLVAPVTVGRSVGVLVGLVSLLGMAGSVGPAAAAPRGRTLPRPAAASAVHGGRSTIVQVPVPAGGDLSYAVAQVRVTGPAKARAGRGAIFTQLAGGLSVQASSSSWQRLRRVAHVYVAISSVRHAAPNLRNVMFFVTRRRGVPGGLSHAAVSFSVSNSTSVLHSYWVRGVNRAGVANVYTAHNAISTALGNWSRYLRVLKLAHALRAAMHPFGVSYQFSSSTAAPAARAATAVGAAAGRGASRHSLPRSGLAFAGQGMDARVRAVAKLIFGTLGDRMAFQTIKKSPLAPQFIAKELANPALAKRWRGVLAQLPLVVPDTYAANAREERTFTTVHAPRITGATVAINDAGNAGSQAAIESSPLASDLPNQGQRVSLHFLGTDAAGSSAGVYISDHGYVTSGSSFSCQSDCSFFVPTDDYVAIQDSRNLIGPSIASGFQGCTAGIVNDGPLKRPTCHVRIGTGATVNVSLFFDVPATRDTTNALNVSLPGSGSGTVTSAPAGIACPTQCSNEFPVGAAVTLTAVPDSRSVFVGSSGCDSTTVRTCTVTLGFDRTVSMDFEPVPPARGILDGTFGTAGSVLTAVTSAASSAEGAKGLAIEADGKYVAAGTGTDANGNVVTTVARYTTAGALDPSFGAGGVAVIPASTFPGKTFFTEGVGIQPGTGDIILGGTLATGAGTPGDDAVAALTPSGALDPSFGTGGVVDTTVPGTGFAKALLVDPSTGDIYLGGSADNATTSAFAFAVVAYQPNGSPLASFGTLGQAITPSGTATVIRALAFDGSAIVASGTSGPSTTDGAVMRYLANGTPDPSFNGAVPATFSLGGQYTNANAVLVQSDRSIVIGGEGSYVPPSGPPPECMILARLTPAGALDTTFAQNGFAHQCLGSFSAAHALVQSTDGAYIYAVGESVNGTTTSVALARFTAAGALDSSFATGGVALTSPAGTNINAVGSAIALDGADPVIAGSADDPGPPFTLYFALQRFH